MVTSKGDEGSYPSSNHAIALEDRGLFHRAVKSYEQTLQLDPTFVDAHYNAGVLLEMMGDGRSALRHFGAAGALTRASGRGHT